MAVKNVYTKKDLEAMHVKELRQASHAVFGKGSWISLARREEMEFKLEGKERREHLVGRKRPKSDDVASAFAMIIDLVADAVEARMKQRRMKG